MRWALARERMYHFVLVKHRNETSYMFSEEIMKAIKSVWVCLLLIVLLMITGCLDGGGSGCSSGTTTFTAPSDNDSDKESDEKSDEESHLNFKTEQLIVLQV